MGGTQPTHLLITLKEETKPREDDITRTLSQCLSWLIQGQDRGGGGLDSAGGLHSVEEGHKAVEDYIRLKVEVL